jgi:lipoprotein-anchoring transpeptidase ErfK/SrfK
VPTIIKPPDEGEPPFTRERTGYLKDFRMGRKAQISIIAVILLLIGGAVGAYAWDASKEDEIAEGVRIGGVDVSGMSRSEAQAEVRAAVVKPLAKPVTVTRDGTKYILTPEKLDYHADIESTVDQAFEASREGGLPTRLWRYATGGEVDEDIEPTVSYDEKEIDAFIAKIAEDVEQAPVDASIEPGPASLNVVPGQPGRTLRADELREQVEKAVTNPRQRTMVAQVQEVQPEVTTDEVAAENPTYLTVDRSSFQLRLWEDLKLTRTYTVAIGAVGFDTPVGVYNIQNMAVDPAWNVPNSDWAGDLAGTVVPGGSPENPLKARWMGIFDGAGIHGTDDVGSLGTAASHGCIRMAVPDVIELYDQVDVGTPIYIG